MSSFATEKIKTSAGDYTVEFFTDDSAENPLTDWDHPGMAFYVCGQDSVTTDTLTDAGHAGATLAALIGEHYAMESDAIARRYAKWRAISGSPWALVTGTGSGNVQGHWWDWLVLVDTTPGTYGATPEKISTGTMDTYEAWASGNVFGYVVTAPDGAEVDSCWGFYDVDNERDYVMSLARDAIDADVDDRTKKCQLVGAGFIGLI